MTYKYDENDQMVMDFNSEVRAVELHNGDTFFIVHKEGDKRYKIGTWIYYDSAIIIKVHYGEYNKWKFWQKKPIVGYTALWISDYEAQGDELYVGKNL